MLIAWVSDEWDSAVPGAAIELERDGSFVAEVRSTATGRIVADVQPGTYRLSLAHPDFGSKRVTVTLADGMTPVRIRLLSSELTGFVWPRWARSGEQAELRFHAVEPYRLALWRYGRQPVQERILGWYDEHGPGALRQILPDGDFTATGVAWNRVGYGGNPHHSLLVRAPERSGLYYVHAEGESGAFWSAPWIVAPAADAPHEDIAVLASSNTWNAYNRYGGRSNYSNAPGLPLTPVVNARQDLARFDASATGEWGYPDEVYPALSFERPEHGNVIPAGTRAEDPIAGRLASSMAPAEWRLLSWLEREGFGYDVFGDQQLDDGALDLARYRVLIISVHPEYWTRRMVERVTDWVAAGGRLLSLGGNSLNCEVELPDGRTMRCRTLLSSTDGALGMPDVATGAWLDSRYHRTTGHSEAELLGLATTETGIMTAAPYVVTEGAADHWVYRDIGLQAGDSFGSDSQHERCPGGASGHETDKMTAQTPAAFRLLAKGSNPDEGGAEMVIREDGPGMVFSVGSITWVTCLLVDEQVSRITRTVLERALGPA